MAHDFVESDEVEKLDAYAQANEVEIAAVVADLRTRQVPDGALDDLVTDAAENLGDDASGWGSEINNAGFERQVAFVLQENGRRAGRELIEAAAVEATVSPRP